MILLKIVLPGCLLELKSETVNLSFGIESNILNISASEEESKEGADVLEQLNKAIKSLEELQSNSTRGSITRGMVDIAGWVEDNLSQVLDNLGDVRNELEKQNDHSCNCSHSK